MHLGGRGALNALLLRGKKVETTAPNDGEAPVYRTASGEIEWEAISGFGAASNSTRGSVALTDSTATNLVTIQLPAGELTGGQVRVALVNWNDASGFQCGVYTIHYTALNNGGAITVNLTATAHVTAQEGALAPSWDATTTATAFTIRCNANIFGAGNSIKHARMIVEDYRLQSAVAIP